MRATSTSLGPLAPYLMDLAAAFEARGLRLTLVGGFGLVLRRQWRQEEGAPTLIEAVPPARATEDFDVLLKLEILEDPELRLAIREALTELGYKAKLPNLHFFKPDSGGEGRRDVKVDFLAPLPGARTMLLKVSGIRVGLKDSTNEDSLHGFLTAEAELLLGDMLTVPLEGLGTDGVERRVQVDLPHPFMLMLMKLHAFRDEFEGWKNRQQPRRDWAGKHVTDVYTLAALLTQQEATDLPDLAAQQAQHAVVRDAKGIVDTLLQEVTGLNDQGTLLLLERLSIAPDDLTTFLEMLHDTFR